MQRVLLLYSVTVLSDVVHGAALESEKRYHETQAVIALSAACVLMVALIAHLYFRI